MKPEMNLKKDFPAFDKVVNGHALVYLDSAATSLKPRSVIEVIHNFNSYESANVHRGAHYLSDRATEKFEAARRVVQKFINAKSETEIVFTKGTTDSINFVAQTFGEQLLVAGDEILISEMEHHSNIVPWQILAKKNELILKWVPVTDNGELDYSALKKLLTDKTKIVSIVHCSNALGTVNDIKEIISLAHGVGAKVLIDAAQSVTFQPIDVQDLDCDFLAFSAHKLYGPFGVGILYGKHKILDALSPLQGGGAMISSVTKEGVSFLGSPQKFEAGTPNVCGVIALAAAIQFINKIGLSNIYEHEADLSRYAMSELQKFENIKIIGTSPSRVNIISFVIEGVHPSDLGQILDQQGVAVRVGHHCTQPLMHRYGLTGTVRASFGVYNSREDVDSFIGALKKAVEILL